MQLASVVIEQMVIPSLQEPAREQETALTQPASETETETTETRAVSQPLELSSPEARVSMEETDGDRPQPIGIDATENTPVVKIRQLPRCDLTLQEKLGEGEYGPIYRSVCGCVCMMVVVEVMRI